MKNVENFLFWGIDIRLCAWYAIVWKKLEDITLKWVSRKYHNTFDEDKEGWTVFQGTEANLSREAYSGASRDYYLALRNRYTSWTSPAVDVYRLIRAYGPGTYTVHARIRTNSGEPNLEARLVMRSYKSYSFIPYINNNHVGGIGTLTQVYKDEWTDLSASFKVLPEDIEESTGEFSLCFDYLEDDGGTLCVDDVVICKLNDTDVTNGSFSYDTVGWRSWGEYGTLYRTSVREPGGIFSMGYYLKSSVYGSIACNVDQILSYYGSREYQVDFDLYLTQEAHAYLEKMVFYLSSENGGQNVYIGQRTRTQLIGDGRTHITLTIDTTDLAPGSRQNIYDLFSPSRNQVLFRMEYLPRASAGIITDEEYGISNVSFRAKNAASFVPSQYTVITNSFLEIMPGESFQLNATVYPVNSTYQNVTWHSSDPYYLAVDSTGRITAAMHSGAEEQTVTITARAGDGLSQTTCTVTIKDLQFKYLKEKFGFDTRVCNILEDIRDALKSQYPINSAHADYMYNRIVGGFQYFGTSWNAAAGNPYPGTNEQSYVTGQLGISFADYKYVRYHVRLQNDISSNPDRYDPQNKENNIVAFKENYDDAIGKNTSESEFINAWGDIYNRYYNKGDFAHQSYTTSALLYGGNSESDEDKKDLAGWLGDTSLIIGGSEYPTLGADDYYADLDSENIVYFMKQNNWNYKKSFENYYGKVGNEYTRAEIFLKHTSIETIRTKTAAILLFESANLEGLINSNKNVVACYNLVMNLRNNNNTFVVYKEVKED